MPVSLPLSVFLIFIFLSEYACLFICLFAPVCESLSVWLCVFLPPHLSLSLSPPPYLSLLFFIFQWLPPTFLPAPTPLPSPPSARLPHPAESRVSGCGWRVRDQVSYTMDYPVAQLIIDSYSTGLRPFLLFSLDESPLPAERTRAGSSRHRSLTIRDEAEAWWSPAGQKRLISLRLPFATRLLCIKGASRRSGLSEGRADGLETRLRARSRLQAAGKLSTNNWVSGVFGYRFVY